MLDYLDTQKHWLQVVSLPGYAPELNPVEGLWSSLKGRELANRCESTIGAVVGVDNPPISKTRGKPQFQYPTASRSPDGLSLCGGSMMRGAGMRHHRELSICSTYERLIFLNSPVQTSEFTSRS
jgi:DDE superfamily endonuclease